MVVYSHVHSPNHSGVDMDTLEFARAASGVIVILLIAWLAAGEALPGIGLEVPPDRFPQLIGLAFGLLVANFALTAAANLQLDQFEAKISISRGDNQNTENND